MIRNCSMAVLAACLGLGAVGAAKAQAVSDADIKAHPIPKADLVTRGPGGKMVPNFAGMYYPDPTVAGTNGPNDTSRATRVRNEFSAFNGYSTNGNTPPPLTPEAMKKYQAQKAEGAAEQKAGKLDDQELKCRAPLFWDYYAYNELTDILQRDDEILIVNMRQRSMAHHIMIGRKQTPEEDVEYTPNGHSVAHWDGKTLVVDTIGISADTWLTRRDRLTHSDKLHIVERYSLSNDGYTLTDVATLTDPETFTKPWTVTIKFRKAVPGTEPIEEECNVDKQVY